MARQMAMRVCRDETELRLEQIGELFGGIHDSAVSQNVRLLHKRLEADRAIGQGYRAVVSRLDP